MKNGMKDQRIKTKEARERNKSDSSLPVGGVVTARKCKYSQHHELGIKTKTGYLQLKPGMKIQLLGE
jgi:exosome complex RNA-binding protein Rrp4